jgi:AAA15 family ATPase/GTPase
MIKNLTIRNFKSIKDLQLSCKRVNLFIGEPNVGKSNILEAISLYAVQQTLSVADLVRINDLSNLFFENNPSNTITVDSDRFKTEISYQGGQVLWDFENLERADFKRRFMSSFEAESFKGQGASWDVGVHPYIFLVLPNFPELSIGCLSVPFGSNLYLVLQSNKQLRTLVSHLVQDRGFKLTLRQKTHEIELSREEDNIVIAYPYTLISDTLQRIIFYTAAIETNVKDNILIFEEPESNVFPYYTRFLGEKIAFDDKQYFMTTHNPYFLQSIVEKTNPEDLAVHLVQMEEHATIVQTLSEKGKEEILNLSSDVFLNFDRLVDA